MSRKIAFMGTPAFAATVLEHLIAEGYEIVLAVTQEDKKTGRKQILTPPPVKVIAEKYHIPVFQPHRIRESYEEIFSYEPDLIITSAYGQIVPKALLDYPKYHCINTHASLLPKYRGAAPIQRAIMNGEEVTGMSIMYMNEKMDEGDIIVQRELKIEETDTNSILFDKLAEMTCGMLDEVLPKIFNDEIAPLPQDHDVATYAPMLKKEEEFISFREDVKKTYDHIRGLLNEPGAYGILDGRKYKFLSVGYERNETSVPGVFEGLEKDHLRIGAEGGSILVYRIKPEGKNDMDAKAFYNGTGKSLTGKRFETSL